MSEGLFPNLPGGVFEPLDMPGGVEAPTVAMTVAVTNGGSSPLINVTVKPFLRENQHARQTYVRVRDTSDNLRAQVGPRPRTKHLLSVPYEQDVEVVVGVKDEYDLWSEATVATAFAATNFSAGSTEASIASGTTDAQLLESPAIAFPDISVGSGSMQVFRTVIGTGFYDETRRAQMSKSRAAFTVKLRHIDEIQAMLFQRFFAALNGPMSPFWLDWLDPLTREIKPYIVRFREASISDQLVRVSQYDLSFVLIELSGTGLGIDI